MPPKPPPKQAPPKLGAQQSTETLVQKSRREFLEKATRFEIDSGAARRTPAQDTSSLATTTYGVEVEKYNLAVDAAEIANFVRDVKLLSKEEQKQKVRKELEVDVPVPDQQTSALCFIRNPQGHVIMEVRLDGEKEISTSKEEAPIDSSCFNIEFISVGAGIKKHQAFFEDVSKGADSEISKVVSSFEQGPELKTEH